MKTQLAILRKDKFLSSHPNWTHAGIKLYLKQGDGDPDAYLWKGAKIVEIRVIVPKKKVKK
jgi:hypothetical protein